MLLTTERILTTDIVLSKKEINHLGQYIVTGKLDVHNVFQI